MHKIAVIIINYNSSELTINCINSIVEKTSTTLDYEITVIDNASEFSDYSNLKEKIKSINFTNLKLIRSKINTGFGGGNMLGVNNSNAEYYAFINNDSLLENDCLNIMLKEMENNSRIGISGPLCHTEKGDLLPTLDYFASPLKEFFGRKILHSLFPKKYTDRIKIQSSLKEGQLVAGSFMLIKSSDFHKAGGFDTNIFLYYEETDLCLRLNKLNKFAYLIPNAKFIHFHGASTPKSEKIKIELKISLLYVIRKHYGYFSYKLLLTYLQVKYFFSSLIKPKHRKLFLTLLKGAPLSKSLKQEQVILEK